MAAAHKYRTTELMRETQRSPEEALFEAACLKSNAAERAAFLDGACRDNPALRKRLELLLEGHFAAAGFLTKSVNHATLLEGTHTSEPDTIDRYKILEKLGEGGCGLVYVAEQTVPVRRRVALKVIKLGMDTKAVVARFEAERQALAMMDHPNIAKVLDAGTTEAGRPYFVMELVRGIRITDYCDQNNLSTTDRLDLFIKICHAIQHAHQKGIIHRDIKPSNILVTLHDGVPVPKVIDFGIAKATEGRLTDATVYTQLHQFIGTPAYMSPEQAEMSGLDIDTRSDIYSLGVLLYELLTGAPPFDGGELMARGLDEMRKTIREKEPVRPSTRLAALEAETLTTAAKRRSVDAVKLISQLRGDLDWVVMKCIEKDRTRRYETANGLAADLKRHLTNEPVTARPPSATYKFRKAWHRNRVTFTAAAAVALALIFGTAISTWQAVVAIHARTVSVQAQVKAESESRRADNQAQKASASEQHARQLLYVADINLAQQSLTLNNLGKARRLLDRHRPQPGEEDLRGWEWRYLWRQTRSSSLVTLTNRSTRGSSTSFSPDGNLLAVGWYDGVVELWDVPARRPVRIWSNGERLSPAQVAFSPKHNLLAATADKGVVLYDLDLRQESVVWTPNDKSSCAVSDLSFSWDGSKLAIYARFGAKESSVDEVIVFNTSSLKVEGRHKTLSGVLSHFGSATLSPNGRYLYLARSDFATSQYSIQCVNSISGERVWENEPGHDNGLTTLAVSADGCLLASGSGFEDPSIRIWDASNGRFLARLQGHTGWVTKLVFATGGQLLSAGADQTIRSWDTNTWSQTRVWRGHADEVETVSVSSAAKLIASASKDGDLLLWKEDRRATNDGYRRMPASLTGTKLIALDPSNVLLLDSSKAPELLDLGQDSAPVPLTQIISTNVIGPLTDNILCEWNGADVIHIREWRAGKFDLVGSVRLNPAMRPALCAFNSGARTLAWCVGSSSPASVYLANIDQPGPPIELRTDLATVDFLSFSGDGHYLCIGFERNYLVRIWNVQTRRPVISLNERVRDWAFAPQTGILALGLENGEDHEIRFYDLANPAAMLQRYPGKYYAAAVAASSNGLIASASGGGEIRLFGSAQAQFIETLHGHRNSVFGLAFSPDGRRLISTAGSSEAVKVWDTDTRQELLTLPGAGSILFRAKWSADGNAIIAGTPWQAWTAPSWEEITRLELAETAANLRR